MNATIRSAIIGCGPTGPQRGGAHSIAYAHALSYSRCDGVKLVAAASRSEKNIRDFTNEFSGVKPYRDYKEMLAKEKPDMVSVCAFSRDREAMVCDALRSGAKIVWAEKPFALSLGSADRMLALAKECGARIFVNHQRRFGKPFEMAAALLKEGKIGELRAVDVTQPGGGVLNFGTHCFDLGLFFLGDRKPKSVMGAVDMHDAGKYQDLPDEHHFLASVVFEDGVRLCYEMGGGVAGKLPMITLHGTEGFIELHGNVPEGAASVLRASLKGETAIYNPALTDHFHHNAPYSMTFDSTPGKDWKNGPNPNIYYDRILIDIIRANRTSTPSRSDASEARRALEMLVGACESARLAKVVSFPVTMSDVPVQWQ